MTDGEAADNHPSETVHGGESADGGSGDGVGADESGDGAGESSETGGDGVRENGEVGGDRAAERSETVADGETVPDGTTVIDGEQSLDDVIAAEQPDPGGASAWRIGPERIRRVGLLAVGCVVAGIGLAIGYGQPPLTALFRGSVLGVFAFLLLTAALFVYWSVRQTMAR